MPPKDTSPSRAPAVAKSQNLYIDCDSPLGASEPHEPHDPHQGTWKDVVVWFLLVFSAAVLGAAALGVLS
jgi:hypothetical protein